MIVEISPITLDELSTLAALYQQLIPNKASAEKMAQALADKRDRLKSRLTRLKTHTARYFTPLISIKYSCRPRPSCGESIQT